MPNNKAVVREAQDNGPVITPLWVPKEGHMLLIELPGERLLAHVAKVVNPDTVICELVNVPLMSKGHHYEKGDFVPCSREHTNMETIWKAFRVAPRTEATPPPKTRRKKKNAS